MTELPEAFRLDGRVAVITGAASGIGRATAIRLAEAGAQAVLADLDERGMAETQKLVEKASGESPLVVPTDVARQSEIEGLVTDTIETCGRIDVMANVAGIMRTKELVHLSERDLDHVLGVNFKGTFFGVQAALRAMAEQGDGGSIVNTASAAIDLPGPGYGAYAISKAAVAMLTRTAATEGGPHRIRVNAVAPGFVETGMTSRWWTHDDGGVDDERRRGMLDTMAKGSPLNTTGEPDDIALAILYLASDASRYVTGQILRPNGGTAMPW